MTFLYRRRSSPSCACRTFRKSQDKAVQCESGGGESSKKATCCATQPDAHVLCTSPSPRSCVCVPYHACSTATGGKAEEVYAAVAASSQTVGVAERRDMRLACGMHVLCEEDAWDQDADVPSVFHSVSRHVEEPGRCSTAFNGDEKRRLRMPSKRGSRLASTCTQDRLGPNCSSARGPENGCRAGSRQSKRQSGGRLSGTA